MQPVIDKNGNALDVILSEDVGVMVSDPIKVQQSLLNLLSNAAKFTTDGKITLQVKSAESSSGERVQLIVTDSGNLITLEGRCLYRKEKITGS